MMELFIVPRAGIWCRSLSGWDAFRAALAAGHEPEARLPEPVPDLLPAREARRAPLHVRLAIEVGTQACRENAVPLADVMTVFASAAGDTQITDYLCRALAGPAPMLSPTKFHTSVHNAASGYWSIGAANRLASVAVAAQSGTFPAGLLEAACLAICGHVTVLLVAYDVPAPPPLDAVSGNRQPFAVGLLLSSRQITPQWRALSLEYRVAPSPGSEPGAPFLRDLATENDCARSLALLEALAGQDAASLALPLNDAGHLYINLGT